MERLSEQVERCGECRGHVIRAGEEYVCTSCGKVVRQVEEEEKFHLEVHIQAPSQLSDTRLGSYVGDRSDKHSQADFNGVSTLGFAKLLSDTMGMDGSELKCKAMIRRVADRLFLPAFVQQNATALAWKVLAEGDGGKRRIRLAAVSAYSILSAARAAGMDHVSPKAIMQAFNDIGQKVTTSALLHLGMDSSVDVRPSDPAALLRTVLNGLQTDERVLKRLRKNGIEPGPYFRRLLQASQTVLAAMDGIRDGRNPRTVAAGSVYLASKGFGPSVLTQGAVAEIVGVTEYTIRDFCGAVNRELGPLNPGPS